MMVLLAVVTEFETWIAGWLVGIRGGQRDGLRKRKLRRGLGSRPVFLVAEGIVGNQVAPLRAMAPNIETSRVFLSLGIIELESASISASFFGPFFPTLSVAVVAASLYAFLIFAKSAVECKFWSLSSTGLPLMASLRWFWTLVNVTGGDVETLRTNKSFVPSLTPNFRNASPICGCQ